MAQINIKVSDELKDDVNKIFNDMGLDITSGIKIYLKRVQHDKKIPFEVKSTKSKVDDLVEQYKAGNEEVVTSLNTLFSKLGQHNDSAQKSIGGAILNRKKTEHNVNGIGTTILNKR